MLNLFDIIIEVLMVSNGSARIVGGKQVGTEGTPDSIPWQVGLVQYPLPNIPLIFCGGALLSANYIISAAHCSEPYNNIADPRSALIGMDVMDDITDLRRKILHDLGDVKLHPDYEEFRWSGNNGKFGIYDLMIISLKNPLINICHSAFARLPSAQFTDVYLKNKKLTLSGWGSTLEMSRDQQIELVNNPNPEDFLKRHGRQPWSFPNYLQVAEITYLPYTLCQNRYETFFERYKNTKGSKSKLKAKELRFEKHGMMCTSFCTSDDVSKCQHRGYTLGTCIGDSGCK